MNKILVPYDFSKPAKNAFNFAAEIASKTGGEVVIIHVIYTSPMYETIYLRGHDGNLNFIQEMQESIQKDLLSNSKLQTKPNISTKIISTNGSIVAAILEKIAELGIDLVVMGTSGNEGLDGFLFGSITKKIIRKSNVPVLALENEAKVSEIKHILLPSNLELGQENFIQKVKALQAFFDAHIHLLLINTPMHFQPEAEGKMELDNFVKHHRLQNCQPYFTNHWTEEKGIIAFQSSHKIDLIAMSTHVRKGLSHAFYGSITEDTLQHSKCPIWTFRI
ncbi:universal stress protein [Echinicola salinicaeni]|uniref:universal stress protein n=1 Tax=Echinicola salinicaeni TaxID=2762757 RepID=UPI0016494C2C|nr:universal stress protein [Echinicola salinicaeni]